MYFLFSYSVWVTVTKYIILNTDIYERNISKYTDIN